AVTGSSRVLPADRARRGHRSHGPWFLRLSSAGACPPSDGSRAGFRESRLAGNNYEGVIEMTETNVTWLTQESHDRLKSELDALIANRPVIAAEINERREEGDLKENGGYHAAREEQGQQEARI